MRIQLGSVLLIAPPGLHLRCYAYTGQLSANVAALVRVLSERGGRFIDAGAFAGQHSQHAYFASSGECEVLAFEPDPRARELLIRNLAESGADEGVGVRPEALSDRSGVIGFRNETVVSTSKVVDSLPDGADPFVIAVPTVDCRELVSSWRPTVMKLDLEGHEPVVLDALLDTADLPPIIAENNPGVGESAERLGCRIFHMEELIPEWTNFSNVSDDILIANERLVTEGFLTQLRREMRHVLEPPVISWL